MEQELTPAEPEAVIPREAPEATPAGAWRARGRRVWRVAARLLIAILLFAGAFLVLTGTGRYVLRAAWEEAKILARRRPIVELVRDPATPGQHREKLRLVLQARAFAVDSLRLRARESFTTFSQLDRDTLVLVLSGAYRDRLEPYTWWFPIVGRVPYKGYFDFDAARGAVRDLQEREFDTYLRPASAFSTLGWFNDPLTSTMLRADSLDLANTVIHELVHNSFYAPDQAVFNESFANFVGARGSAWFFRARGSDGAAIEENARWSDDKLMARFWERLKGSIDSAYRAHPGDRRTRIAARDMVYARARVDLVYTLGPQLRTLGPRLLERMRLDNAALLARRIYLTDLDLFDAVYRTERCDLRAAFERIVELAKERPRDPYGALRDWLASPRSRAAAPAPEPCP